MSRDHEFGDELRLLLERFADVPRGTRGMTLLIALGALMAAEKGSIPTDDEFERLILPMIRKLARSGALKTYGETPHGAS